MMARRITPPPDSTDVGSWAQSVGASLDAARAFAAAHWLVSLDEATVSRKLDTLARRAESGAAKRPLEGMLVAIKDQFDVRDEVTTCGTRFYRRLATNDAAAVARLERAGAIAFGKANMGELTLGPTGRNIHYGDAANPWDPARDTGGSSSGSAALVAAGLTPLALGSDLGGSVRIPGAFCGITALKPTFGAITSAGVVPVAPTLEHVGLLGRDVQTVATAFRVLSEKIETPLLGHRPRLGVSEAWWAHACPDVQAITKAAIERATKAHAVEVRSIRLPSIERASYVGALLATAEAARSWAWALSTREATRGPAALAAPLRIALAVGREITPAEIDLATRVRREISAAIEQAFMEVDFIVTPTTDTVAPFYSLDGARGEVDEDAVMARTAFSMPFNLAGLPAVQVPCGFDTVGMPVGLQIAAPRNRDLAALDLAALVQSTAERRAPAVSLEIVGEASHSPMYRARGLPRLLACTHSPNR
jgi:Asp-tRNA(Asn)/Glu-tRNA(Gln) amidotransferase A subunit family amidase